MSSDIPVRPVVCPSCKGPSVYSSGNPYRPFCSERCRNVDFGAWAKESFRVSDPAEAAEDPGLPPVPAPRH